MTYYMESRSSVLDCITKQKSMRLSTTRMVKWARLMRSRSSYSYARGSGSKKHEAWTIELSHKDICPREASD